MNGSDLTWSDLTWSDLTWPELTWPYLIWPKLTWHYVTWSDLTYSTSGPCYQNPIEQTANVPFKIWLSEAWAGIWSNPPWLLTPWLCPWPSAESPWLCPCPDFFPVWNSLWKSLSIFSSKRGGRAGAPPWEWPWPPPPCEWPCPIETKGEGLDKEAAW